MLTIGQLARYVGVSTKTVRVYHDKGLLPEPERDASGYRRYDAHDAVALIKIRTLAEAGVPLARIRELSTAGDEEQRRALDEIDAALTARIEGLRETQERLRWLAEGQSVRLPVRVRDHLDRLAAWGFSPDWVELQRDLWVLVYVTHPELADSLFSDQAASLDDPSLRALFLDYDRARTLDPADPRIDDLARRIAAATRERYGNGELPGASADSSVPALIQESINAASPAWQRLDSLIRAELNA